MVNISVFFFKGRYRGFYTVILKKILLYISFYNLFLINMRLFLAGIVSIHALSPSKRFLHRESLKIVLMGVLTKYLYKNTCVDDVIHCFRRCVWNTQNICFSRNNFGMSFLIYKWKSFSIYNIYLISLLSTIILKF